MTLKGAKNHKKIQIYQKWRTHPPRAGNETEVVNKRCVKCCAPSGGAGGKFYRFRALVKIALFTTLKGAKNHPKMKITKNGERNPPGPGTKQKSRTSSALTIVLLPGAGGEHFIEFERLRKSFFMTLKGAENHPRMKI